MIQATSDKYEFDPQLVSQIINALDKPETAELHSAFLKAKMAQDVETILKAAALANMISQSQKAL